LKSDETKKKSIIWEYTEAVIIGLVLALVIRTFVVQAFKIPSESMEPTLEIGDHLLVNKFIYGQRSPLPLFIFFLGKVPSGETSSCLSTHWSRIKISSNG
jgi:signal peptidase I